MSSIPVLIGLLPQSKGFRRIVLFAALVASTTNPNLALMLNHFICHMFYARPLPDHSRGSLSVPWLLCTDKRMLILPHSTVTVIWMVRTTIGYSTRDALPTSFWTYEMPCSCSVNLAADQNIIGFTADVARFAESGGRDHAFLKLLGHQALLEPISGIRALLIHQRICRRNQEMELKSLGHKVATKLM